MIVGIGTDLVNINRIAGVIERKGEQEFLAKNYTKNEIDKANQITSCKKRTAYIAKRFAAKEAFAKALGTGIGKISFKDIGIANEKNGKPYIVLEKNAQELVDLVAPNAVFNLSLSDTDDIAQAFVVISV